MLTSPAVNACIGGVAKRPLSTPANPFTHPSRCCCCCLPGCCGAGWHGIPLFSTVCTPCVTPTTRPFRSFHLPQYQSPLLSRTPTATSTTNRVADTVIATWGTTHSQSLLKKARRRTLVVDLWMLNESSHSILIHCADDTQPLLHRQSRLFPSRTSPIVLAHHLRQNAACLGLLGVLVSWDPSSPAKPQRALPSYQESGRLATV